jgi:hypothetical protein
MMIAARLCLACDQSSGPRDTTQQVRVFLWGVMLPPAPISSGSFQCV